MRVKAEIEPALKAWQTQNRSPKADVSYITSSAVFTEAHFSFHSNTGRTFKSRWQTAMLWRRSISPRGEVYKRYRMGPRTEPWGTPHERECLSDSDTSIWTNWERSVKYDVNQSRALPLIPKLVDNRWSKIKYLTCRSTYLSISPIDRRYHSRKSWHTISFQMSKMYR